MNKMIMRVGVVAFASALLLAGCKHAMTKSDTASNDAHENSFAYEPGLDLSTSRSSILNMV